MSLPPLFRRPTTKIIGSRRSTLDVARGRLVFVGILFALAYILVAARVMDLTLIQGELPRLARMANPEHESLPQQATDEKILRGDIVDRNGVLLSRSLKTASLYADPALITNPEQVAQDLVKALPDLQYGDVLQKLQRKTRFIWLRRNLAPQDQYAILNLGHPGLNFKDEAHRIYPQGELAAHIVGFTDIDENGLGGIERHFNSLLSAGNRPLQLTIDIRLQHIVRRELMAAIKEFSGIGGAAVIMDVNSGEVLAAVSAPDFDPHDVTAKDKNSLFNRLTLGVYEMGSTFKIFSTAALLEIRNPSMEQGFDAREPIKIGRFTINDFHAEKRFLTIPEIFIYSSNIGAARMGEAIGTKALKGFYKDLGLLDPVQIELQEVSRPLVPDPWRDVSTMTASFGHGLAVTPLQTVAGVASIINGGTLVHPTLVLDGALSEKNLQDKKDDSVVRIVSARTSHRMRQLLRLVVSDGTAKAADVPGFQVGGKTGTAEKTGGKGYDKKRLLSSFIGVFPMNAPQYAVLVMIDEPKGTKKTFGFATGGWVAAPAVARIIAAMAPVLGLVPNAVDEDMAESLRPYVKQKDQPEKHLAAVGVE
ncbi:MAG: peptidoglycan D,D-transpeptidase FtsI family protein [Micavibrio sp.]